MSLFLGKIHYWLYNKILWFERIEEEIIVEAGKKNTDVARFMENVNREYGAPAGKKPLEEIIDTSNIHGWLQEKIQSAELRQAALITELLKQDPVYRSQLLDIFTRQGELAARECGESAGTPEEIFNILNDYLLEGMPCDRVNEVVTSSSSEFSWRATECLHKQYWDRAGGDIRNFYYFREAWIKAFVKTLNPSYEYEKSEDNINRIKRLQVKAGV